MGSMGSTTTLKEEDNPYVGPRTFQPEEQSKFFGRDREAYELTSLIIANRLVLFYSPSGAGKSSLLNTMIDPMLTKARFEILPTGRVSGYSDRNKPIDNIFIYNLLSSLHSADEIPPDFETLTLADFLDNLALHKDGAYYYDPDYVYPPDTVFKPRVLFIDQFEELITTNTAAWAQRSHFFRQLAEAMALDEQLWIVLIMREDYVANLDPYLHLIPDQLRYRYYMERLKREEAGKAIKMPVENLRPFEPEAVEQLVDNLLRLRDAEGQSDEQFAQFVEPVQLQAVCFQMWEELRDHPGSTITINDVTRFADVDKALTKFYQETIKRTVKAMAVSEVDLRDWFEQELITEAGTRNMVYRGEEMTGSLPTQVANYVRNQFILSEVIRPGGTWYELVHDRFISPILRANSLWRQEQPLIRLAMEWEKGNRPREMLLSSQQLKQLEGTNWQVLGLSVAEYIKASQLAQREEETKLAAEREAVQQRQLEQQKALFEAQRQRAEEAEAAAAAQKKLMRTSFIIGGIAVLFAIIAMIAGLSASSRANEAQLARDEAEAAAATAFLAQVEANFNAGLAIEKQETAVAGSTAVANAYEVANAALATHAAFLEIQLSATPAPLTTPTLG
jgi:hypothetical protein